MNGSAKRLGVAVIGLGVGERHARAYAALPECELRWLYDLDARRAEALAQILASAVAPDFETVLNDARTDLVSIASYDDAHFGQIMSALEAGKHVFVEKPLCQTLEQLQAIHAAWAAHGGRLKLASNLVLRAAPLYQWLRTKLQAGELGEVYAFDGDYLYGRLPKLTEGWRKDVPDYSVMEGGGIHLMDLMLWLTGQRPATVVAAGNRLCAAGTAFRYDDYATALLQFPSGLVGRITANFGCVHRHQHVVRIFGTRATFIYDDAGPRWHATRDPALTAGAVTLAPLPATKGELIAPFVSAILHDKDRPAETQMIFDGLSVCLACDRARQTRQVETVEYL